MLMRNTNSPSRSNASPIPMFVALVVGLTLMFSLYQTPTYEATVKILVGQRSTEDATSPQKIPLAVPDFTPTVARAIDTEPVAQAVVEQLNMPELSVKEVLANTTVEPDPGTMFIDVSYEDSDPQRAQLIANTIGKVSSQKISDGMVARVWKPATLPKAPISPKPILNTLTALVLGLTVYVGWALAWPHVKRRLSL